MYLDYIFEITLYKRTFLDSFVVSVITFDVASFSSPSHAFIATW